jgi:hypothetical protein
MNYLNRNLDINKYFCFNSNPIFIIPNDLYDYVHYKTEKSNFFDEKNIKSINKQNNSFENLKILSFLNVNWENGIKNTLNSSKKKILQQLGIKN